MYILEELRDEEKKKRISADGNITSIILYTLGRRRDSTEPRRRGQGIIG